MAHFTIEYRVDQNTVVRCGVHKLDEKDYERIWSKACSSLEKEAEGFTPEELRHVGAITIERHP